MTRSSNVVLRPPSRTLTGAYFPVPVLQPMPRHTISIVSSAVDEALFAMIELMGSSVGGLKIRKTLKLIFYGQKYDLIYILPFSEFGNLYIHIVTWINVLVYTVQVNSVLLHLLLMYTLYPLSFSLLIFITLQNYFNMRKAEQKFRPVNLLPNFYQ